MSAIVDFMSEGTVTGNLLAELVGVSEKVPHVPAQIERLGVYEQRGIMTTSAKFDIVGSALSLTPITARLSDPATRARRARDVVSFESTKLSEVLHLSADDIQNVRKLGTGGDLESVASYLAGELAPYAANLRATREFQRVCGLRGFILDADGTVVSNLWTKLGTTEPAAVYFNLGSASPADGAIREACSGVVRRIADALGGVGFTGVKAIMGRGFSDALMNAPEVREVFRRQADVPLAAGMAFRSFEYGGVSFEEYRGAAGATAFVADDEVRFFPMGTRGVFHQLYAPADRVTLNNTLGLIEYAIPFADPKDRFREIELQSNPITVCLRPDALIGGFAGAAPAP